MIVASRFPDELRDTVFTVDAALRLGVTRARLRAADITSLWRGLYAHGTEPPSEAAILTGMVALHPVLWASHDSAARLHGLWVPPAISEGGKIHVSRDYRRADLRLKDVECHRTRACPGEVQMRRSITGSVADARLLLATRERTWMDLAAALTLEELVVLGDQLIRVPRPRLEGRTLPWATPASLAALLEAHPHVPGRRRAVAALALARVGADSPAETKLRLALCAAGLPEPELQVRLDPRDPYSPAADLGYRRYRLAMQYDGGHHRSAAQQSSDNRRDALFEMAQWRRLTFDSADYFNGFHRAAGMVREVIAQSEVRSP